MIDIATLKKLESVHGYILCYWFVLSHVGLAIFAFKNVDADDIQKLIKCYLVREKTK